MQIVDLGIHLNKLRDIRAYLLDVAPRDTLGDLARPSMNG